jgi:4-oxalocrotonate tautomerase
MPLVRIAVPHSVSDSHQISISEAVHDAMVEAFNVPQADRFQILSRLEPSDIVCTTEFLGVKHEGPVVMIQITCAPGRTVEVKKALYASIASKVAARTTVSASNVIINLVETSKENWSFGAGIAQYAI